MNHSDRLDVRVYVLHEDACTLAPYCDSLCCASGVKSSDYVLSAQFAYLQDGLDYAQASADRGVHARLISRLVPGAPFIRDYSPNGGEK